MTATAAQVLVELPIGDVHPDPNNLRRHVDQDVVDGIAATIPELGIIEPLIVSADGDGWMIIAGGNRHAAAALAGLESVPCIVRAPHDEAERLMLQLVENHQRATLSPLEEADAYKRLVTLKVTQRELADRIGCSQSHISKRLSLAKLPAVAQVALEQGKCTVAEAEDLSRITDKAVVEKLVKSGGDLSYAILRALRQQEAKTRIEGWQKEIADAGVPELDQSTRYDGSWREIREGETATAALIRFNGVEWLVPYTEGDDEFDDDDDSEGATSGGEVDPERQARREAWNAAVEGRQAFIKSHLVSSRIDLKAAQVHVNDYILVGAIDSYFEPDAPAACDLLGITYDSDDAEIPGAAELWAYAALTPKAQTKAILALVLADGDAGIRNLLLAREVDTTSRRHFDYLQAAGYTLTDIEQTEITRLTAPPATPDEDDGDEEETA